MFAKYFTAKNLFFMGSIGNYYALEHIQYGLKPQNVEINVIEMLSKKKTTKGSITHCTWLTITSYSFFTD